MTNLNTMPTPGLISKTLSSAAIFQKDEDFNIAKKSAKSVLSGKEEIAVFKSLMGTKSELISDEKVKATMKALASIDSVANIINNMRDERVGDKTISVFKEFIGQSVNKDFNIGSTAQIRIIDVSHAFVSITTDQTPFLDTLPGLAPVMCQDLRTKWFEDNYPASTKDAFFNPNRGPKDSDAVQAEKTNTIGFFGSANRIGNVAESLRLNMGYQPEAEMAVIRKYNYLRRVRDEATLDCTENAVGPIYTPAGVIQQMTNLVVGHADITEAVFNDNILLPITSKYGRSPYVLATSSGAQITKIDDILKTKAPGRNQTELYTGPIQGRIGTVPFSTFFIARSGQIIPVIYLEGCAALANAALLYIPGGIQPVSMNLPTFGGGVGPFAIVSIDSDGWATLHQVFDTMSTQVRDQIKMALISGLN
jgi:hypothetical protein